MVTEKPAARSASAAESPRAGQLKRTLHGSALEICSGKELPKHVCSSVLFTWRTSILEVCVRNSPPVVGLALEGGGS